MAGGLIGANPDQLDALAARMDGDAAALSSVRDSIQWSLSRTDWPGSDGDQFRSDWAYRYAPALANAATMLRDAARVLRINADQQRYVSGASTGHAGPGGGPSGGASGPAENARTMRILAGVDWLLETTQNLTYLGSLIENFEDVTVPLSRFAGAADVFRFGPLDAAALGLSIGELGAELSRGELRWSTIWDVAWNAASLHPIGGAITGAWDAGAAIGAGIANKLDDLGMQQGIIDHTINRLYGDDLSPTEAAEFGTRYDGVGGFVNFVGDSVQAGWSKLFGR